MSKERFEPVKGVWSVVKDNGTGENVETLETLNALSEENERLKKNLMSEEQGNALSREALEKEIERLKNYLEKHFITESEWKDYCAYKHIEPLVKGCLDREIKLKQQLKDKEKELKKFKRAGATPRQLQRAYQERYKYKERCNKLKNQHNQEKISLLVEKLEKFRNWSDCPAHCEYAETGINVVIDDEYFENFIDQVITEIKKLK